MRACADFWPGARGRLDAMDRRDVLKLAAASVAGCLVPWRGTNAPFSDSPTGPRNGTLWVDTSGAPVLKVYRGGWHAVEGAEVLIENGVMDITIPAYDVGLRQTV